MLIQHSIAPVSVIIPAYNAEKSIKKTLSSVARQTLPPSEIIVINDGSSDETSNTVRSAIREIVETRLILLEQKHKGAGAARNLGLKNASQPYIAFLDADDTWLPTKLERSMAVFARGDYVLVAHDYLDLQDDGRQIHINCAKRYAASKNAYQQLYLKGYIASISVVAKRKQILSAGGFDESLQNAQDFDLWLAILQNHETNFIVFDEALAVYSHTPGSIMSHTERRLECCIRIALRYLPALKARKQPVLINLWLRTCILYNEASNRRPLLRLAYTFRLIGALVSVTWSAFFGVQDKRVNLNLTIE